MAIIKSPIRIHDIINYEIEIRINAFLSIVK